MDDEVYYTYQQMSIMFSRSERTIRRWVENCKKQWPKDADRLVANGKITAFGKERLEHYAESLQLTIQKTSTEIDIQALGVLFAQRLKEMIERDKLIAYQLARQATFTGLGEGLREGRDDAINEVFSQINF